MNILTAKYPSLVMIELEETSVSERTVNFPFVEERRYFQIVCNTSPENNRWEENLELNKKLRKLMFTLSISNCLTRRNYLKTATSSTPPCLLALVACKLHHFLL